MAAPSPIVRVLSRAKRLSDAVPVQLQFTQSVVDYLGDGKKDAIDVFTWMDSDPTHLVVSDSGRSPTDRPLRIKSVVDYLGDGKKDAIDVFTWMDSDPTHLVVSDSGRSPTDRPLRIKRPSFCPIHNLSPSQYGDLAPGIAERGVDTGAAVLLESCDGKVLLIRRAKHLRTFPNIWVPAGGHLEQGEKISEAGFRELEEETGITVTDDMLQAPSSTICLWESAFPPKLTAGLPKRHHIVVYLHCKLRSPLTSDHVQKMLKPDPNEVGACAWFDRKVISGIVSASEEGKATANNEDGSIDAHEVCEDGSLKPATVPLSVLYATSDGSKEDIERVSTGTKWALENWLKPAASQL